MNLKLTSVVLCVLAMGCASEQRSFRYPEPPVPLTDAMIQEIGANVTFSCQKISKSAFRQRFCSCAGKVTSQNIRDLGIANLEELNRRKKDLGMGAEGVAICLKDAFLTSLED